MVIQRYISFVGSCWLRRNPMHTGVRIDMLLPGSWIVVVALPIGRVTGCLCIILRWVTTPGLFQEYLDRSRKRADYAQEV